MSSTNSDAGSAQGAARRIPVHASNERLGGTKEEDDEYAAGDAGSTATSVTSTITRYRFENGRRYHAYRDGEYWGPNDEQARESNDIGHHLYTLLLEGKLYLAPIRDPELVLDIGTGTGIWAIDFADTHPTSTVIGTDLSPIQPTFVPPNLSFEIDDCCAPWTYPPNSFSYIHTRLLYGSVADWDRFYSDVFTHLRPGAYFEQLETSVVLRCDDGSIAPGTAFERWGPLCLGAAERFGKSLDIVEEMRERLLRAGFRDVVERRFRLPIGPWSSEPRLKELGRWNRLFCEEGVEGWVLALLTRVMGWTYDEVQEILAQFRAQLHDRRVHAWQWVSVVYGRKPYEDEELS